MGSSEMLTGCIVLAVVGIMMLIASAMMWFSAWKKKKFYKLRVEAVVADFVRYPQADLNEAQYYPVYKFTIGSRQYQKIANASQMKPFCKKGDKVILLCDPKDPEKFYLEKSSEGRLFVIFLILGIILLAGAAVMAISLM